MTDAFAPKQTNTGLYVQMHEAGHSLSDIGRVRQVYRLACRMFNGRYRKTERPFLCHAVGAASSAIHFGASADIAISAMMHAAYDSGQFPDGRNGGFGKVHRQWLRGKIGGEVEAVVYRFASFRFDQGDPERLLAAGIAKGDEDLLFIALAHEVDDLADGGLTFSPKYGESIESRISACAKLATSIGQLPLAAAIVEHGRINESRQWIIDLGERKLRGFRLAPGLRAYLRLRRSARRNGSVELV